MNKPVKQLDQIIKEEYLKLQKEQYIQNLINESVTELSEQRSKSISAGEIRKIVIPILESVGYTVEYAGDVNFEPMDSTDSLYSSKTPIVTNRFPIGSRGPGLKFDNVQIGSGKMQNLQFGLPLAGPNSIVTKFPSGGINQIKVQTKRVAFNITNLPKELSSLSGQTGPFTSDQLKNQYILDPSGLSAVLVITYNSPTNIDIERPGAIKLSQSTNTGTPGSLNLDTQISDKKSSRNFWQYNVDDYIGVWGKATLTNKLSTNTDPIYNKKGAFWNIDIEINGQLIPLFALPAGEPESTNTNITKDNWKQNLKIPTTQGETTPDAFIYQLDPKNRVEMLRLEKDLDASPDEYRDTLFEILSQGLDWLSASVPKWLYKTGQFLAWLAHWIAVNNPISQLIKVPSLDNLQNLFNWLGFIDVFFIGTAFDLVNCVISLCRYGVNGNNRYLLDAAISLFAAIPIFGWGGNFAKIFKGSTSNTRFIKKYFKMSKEQTKALLALAKDKTWKEYTASLIKGDIKGMAKALNKLIKDGKMSREQLQWLAGPDGVQAVALMMASGQKSIKGFESWIVKINKNLPDRSKIDIKWAIEGLDKGSKYLDNMEKSFKAAYQLSTKKSVPQAVGNIVLKTVVEGGKKTVKISGNIIKGTLRFTGILAISNSLGAPFAIAALRATLKNNKIFQKIFSRKKLVDFGKDAAEFTQKLWKQDLFENTAKLSLLMNRSISISTKNFNTYLSGSWRGRLLKGNAAKRFFGISQGESALTLLTLYNKITGSSFKSMNKISKTQLEAFLQNLKAGSFKTVKGMPSSWNLGIVGLGGKAQKELYKDICSAVSSSTINAKSKLFIDFQQRTFENIFNGKLKRYWTREAVQQQGYLVMLNGIFSIKFADIAFDEINNLFDSVGLGWGQDPDAAEKARGVEGVQGVLFKFIYDAAKDFDIPFEESMRASKNFVVENISPYIETIKLNQDITIDMVQYGIDKWSTGAENKIKKRIETSPGLRGDINNTDSVQLIASTKLLLGNKSIVNPWINPRYTGPDQINQELFASSQGQTRKKIGKDWHTGDGKTGRKIEYWRAPISGLPSNILKNALTYDLTNKDNINVSLTNVQRVVIAKQLEVIKDLKKLAAEALKINQKESVQWTWYPGPPTSKERVDFITQSGGLSGDDPSIVLNIMKKLFPDLKKYIPTSIITRIDSDNTELEEQDFPGPFGKEHDYSDYGGPWGTGHHHKTKFKKGPGKSPTKSIGHGRSAEEKEDDRITGYKPIN